MGGRHDLSGDELAGGMVTALIVVFLIAAPLLTVAAGHWVYEAGVRQQHAAAWRQIPAPVQRGSVGQETYSGSLTRPPLRHAPLGARVALGEVLAASGLIWTKQC